MNICLLIDDLDPLRPGGGAQRSTQLIADELVRRGHSIRLVTAGPFDQETSGIKTSSGVLHQYKSKPAGMWSDYLTFWRPSIVRRVLPFILGAQPEIIQAHVVQNYLSFPLLCALKKSLPWVPVVLTMHDHSALCRGALRCKGHQLVDMRTAQHFRLPSTLDCWQCQKHTFNPLKRRALLRVLNQCCDTVVFVSQALRDFYLANGLLSPNLVIYNGAEDPPSPAGPAQTTQLRKEFGMDDKRIILAGGRMRPTKGYHALVEALPEVVRQTKQDVHLVLYGQDNSYAKQLRAQADDLGVGANLTLAGWLTPPQLRALIASTEVGVVPSIGAEALPRSLFEYMIQGVPTIASRVGGSKEVIIDGENGMLIDPWDPAEIALKLTALMKSQDLRDSLGRRGRETILSHFMVSQSVDQRLALYQQLLGT